MTGATSATAGMAAGTKPWTGAGMAARTGADTGHGTTADMAAGTTPGTGVVVAAGMAIGMSSTSGEREAIPENSVVTGLIGK